jgi:hypothetical protein
MGLAFKTGSKRTLFIYLLLLKCLSPAVLCSLGAEQSPHLAMSANVEWELPLGFSSPTCKNRFFPRSSPGLRLPILLVQGHSESRQRQDNQGLLLNILAVPLGGGTLLCFLIHQSGGARTRNQSVGSRRNTTISCKSPAPLEPSNFSR